MDPLDCDGEANPRPISPSAALALIPAADAIGNGLVRDVDDVIVDPTTGEIPWWTCGGDCDGEPGGPKVSASGHVAIIVQANARAARGDDGDCDGDEHRCSLCSVTIAPTAQRDVWTWTPERERHPITLHAHRGCNAIRREIDLGEWTQGDLVDRLVAWHEDERLNRDLGELDAGLTPEERDDMGGEIIAAAIRTMRVRIEDEQTDDDPQDRP